MNQQQQIDIIQAHMAGKRVLSQRTCNSDGGLLDELAEWREVTKGEFHFNFAHYRFRIDHRRIELFMQMPSGALQAMAREGRCSHSGLITNYPPVLLDGMVVVQINYLEP